MPPNDRTAVTRYSQARTTYNEQNQNERAVTQITRLHHTVMYGNINTLKHQVVHALLHGSNDNNTTTHAAKLPERTDKRKKEEVQILTKTLYIEFTFTFTFKHPPTRALMQYRALHTIIYDYVLTLGTTSNATLEYARNALKSERVVSPITSAKVQNNPRT